MAGVSDFAVGDDDEDGDEGEEEGTGAGKRPQSQAASPYEDLDDRHVWDEERRD